MTDQSNVIPFRASTAKAGDGDTPTVVRIEVVLVGDGHNSTSERDTPRKKTGPGIAAGFWVGAIIALTLLFLGIT